MAATPPIAEPESGAPVPRDAIDPELIKLSRPRSKIGAVTAAAVVGLCGFFLLRLGPDRGFSGQDEKPRAVALADIAAGKVPTDSYISVDAEPMMSQALRTFQTRGDLGYRVTPARGTSERVWLVLSGDGWEKPSFKAYVGRLRRIGDLPFAGVIDKHATRYPRPMFATAAAARAALAGGPVATVAGDKVTVADGDKVAFDTVDPGRSTVIATFTGKREPAETGKGEPAASDPGHGPLTDPALWIAELAKHGITATVSATPGQVDAVLGQVRLEVAMPVADVTARLEAAKLWAARVERVTRHHETTWGALRASPPTGFTVSGQTVPDAHVDLVGLFVQRGVPADAYALITGEQPQDYWYILPLTVALAIIGLLFAWALVRAVRELVPARVPVPAADKP